MYIKQVKSKVENKNLGILTPPRLRFSTTPDCLRFEMEKADDSMQPCANALISKWDGDQFSGSSGGKNWWSLDWVCFFDKTTLLMDSST